MLTERKDLKDVKSRVFYGLIILIELADVYNEKGCSLTELSEKYGFAHPMFLLVVDRLVGIGVIARSKNDEDWIYLVKEPRDLWVLEVLPVLKASLEEGEF